MLINSLPFALVTDSPSKNTSPSVASINLFINLNKVDLPAPESPIIATNSPWSIFRLTLFKALTPLGYTLLTPLNSITFFSNQSNNMAAS